jgi:cell division protein FtsI (penicillin-binding protein 3)
MFIFLLIYNSFNQDKGYSVSSNNKSLLRKSIVDRNGFPLAISIATYDMYLDVRNILSAKKGSEVAQSILDIKVMFGLKNTHYKSIGSFIKFFSKNKKNRHFIVLKDIPSNILGSIKKKIEKHYRSFIFFDKKEKRVYPNENLVSNIIGLVGSNSNGQFGIEFSENKFLSNTNKPSNPLRITIDSRMQAISNFYLNKNIIKHNAESGAILIVDVKKGEILASSSFPSFNPNNRRNLDLTKVKNIAFQKQFNIGSAIKPLILSAILDSGEFHINDIIDLSSKKMILNGKKIEDKHIKESYLSVLGVITRSSNLGMSKMALKVGSKKILRRLSEFGFGYKTDANFPGEASGYLKAVSNMPDIDLASMSYGYGVEATLAQVASAYQSIANNGIKVPLSFVFKPKKIKGTRVMKKKTSYEILLALEDVVNNAHGTARRAKNSSFIVGGKTGTIRAFDRKTSSYSELSHRVLFIGVAPINNPEVVIAIMLNKPQIEHASGGLVAAPIFSSIADKIIFIKRHATNTKFLQNIE